MNIFAFVLLLFFVNSSYSKEICVRSLTVTVHGKTCETVAEENDMSVDDLQRLNNISCESSIKMLTKICFQKVNVTYECTKSSKITIPSLCSAIYKQANVTEAEFLEHNPNASCTNDMLTIDVCSNYEAANVECPDKYNGCKEVEHITEKNNCSTIAKKYGMDLKKLEEKYNCKDRISKKSRDVCVSKSCQFRYETKSNMTCENVTTIFKLNTSEIEMSTSQKCGKGYLPVGVKLCVWPAKSEQFPVRLPDISCVEKIKLIPKANISLSKLAHNFSMTIDEFQFHNPNYENSTEICTKTKSSIKCVQFETVKKGRSCESFAYGNSMTMKEFMRINPTLRCDRLEYTKEVCIMTGYFNPNQCTKHTTVFKNDTCLSVYSRTSTSKDLIEAMNPGIDCDKPSERKIRVCVQSFGMDTDEAHEIMGKMLRNISIDLYDSYTAYVNNQQDSKAKEGLSNVFGAAMKNKTTYGKIKELYRNNTEFRNILDNYERMGAPNTSGNYYCVFIRKSKFSNETKDCFCNDDELKMYCKSLAAVEIERAKKQNRDVSRRVKRSGCNLDLEGKTKNDHNLPCKSIGCDYMIPSTPLQIKVKGELCFPDLSEVQDIIDADNIEKTIKNIFKIDETIEELLEKVIESSAAITFSLCLVGTELLELIGTDACWHALKIEYALLAKRVTISTELNLPVFEATARVVFQTPGPIDFSFLCEKTRFACKDYCQDYEFYGSAEVKGKLLFIEGPTLYEDKWNDPLDSCSPDEYRIFFEYTKISENFNISIDGMGQSDYRPLRFKEGFFYDEQSYIFSFKNNTMDRNITIVWNNIDLASFPVFGKQFQALTGQGQRKMSYFRLQDDKVYYREFKKWGGEKEIATVDWSKKRPNSPKQQ